MVLTTGPAAADPSVVVPDVLLAYPPAPQPARIPNRKRARLKPTKTISFLMMRPLVSFTGLRVYIRLIRLRRRGRLRAGKTRLSHDPGQARQASDRGRQPDDRRRLETRSLSSHRLGYARKDIPPSGARSRIRLFVRRQRAYFPGPFASRYSKGDPPIRRCT